MPKLISAIFALLGFAILNSESVAQDAIKVGYAIQAHQANMMVLPKFAEKYGLKVDLVGRGGPALRDSSAAWLRWILGSITPPISPRLPA